tara:strand:- start:36 stop:401 length:366 start_codon:yes stop_codon:yes gene_type:complete
VRSELHNEEKNQQKSLDEESVLAVINKIAKRNRESIEEFKKGNRDDLVEREEAELQVLLGYLPEQLTDEEIYQLASQIVQDTKAQGPSDKGKVMSAIMPQVRGKADGAVVNKIVMGILDNL